LKNLFLFPPRRGKQLESLVERERREKGKTYSKSLPPAPGTSGFVSATDGFGLYCCAKRAAIAAVTKEEERKKRESVRVSLVEEDG